MLTEKIKKKLKGNRKGFTLMELMVSTLIIVLLSTVMANGLPLILKTYREVVKKSDADVLLSTVMSEIRNELSNATEITLSADGKSIDYRSTNSGAISRISVDETGIILTRFKGVDTSESDPYSRLLVSEKAATENLKTTFEKLSLTDGVITVRNLKVTDTEGNEMCSLASFGIRSFASD